jgi:hypothetical protein
MKRLFFSSNYSVLPKGFSPWIFTGGRYQRFAMDRYPSRWGEPVSQFRRMLFEVKRRAEGHGDLVGGIGNKSVDYQVISLNARKAASQDLSYRGLSQGRATSLPHEWLK